VNSGCTVLHLRARKHNKAKCQCHKFTFVKFSCVSVVIRNARKPKLGGFPSLTAEERANLVKPEPENPPASQPSVEKEPKSTATPSLSEGPPGPAGNGKQFKRAH